MPRPRSRTVRSPRRSRRFLRSRSTPRSRRSGLASERATITRVSTIERLVDELERSHAEAQERMADPAVYNDHRKAAETGRRLKELEAPKRLADEWRQASADLDAARNDPELQSLAEEYESQVERLEEELRLALVEKDPADEKDVIVEIRQGVGGDEAAIWAGEALRMPPRNAES